MKKGIMISALALLLGITTIMSCSNSNGTKTFPKGFLWGVSTAAEQSEGGITNNDWYVWEQMGKTPPVGLADNFYNLYAQDFANAQAMNHAYNLTILDALTSGKFDNGLTGTTNISYYPSWAHTLDYIGVNYYNNDYVVSAPNILSPINAIPCDETINAYASGILASFGCPYTTDSSGTQVLSSPSETQGLTNILVEYAQRYHLPMLVTENGYSGGDPVEKAKYIVQNIMAVKNAINHGADMLGYMYWTLNYDYEWTLGYAQNFGLFYVDDFTSCTTPFCGLIPSMTTTGFTRTPVQPAVDVYSAIAAANDVTPTIIDQYGH